MHRLAEMLKLVFSSSAREKAVAKADKLSRDISLLTKEHSYEVNELRRVLADAPPMRLVVEPERNRLGQFKSRKHH